eukprot:CAMPEP_0184321902 /NCGR_PEP_ID=MMETSP1049-20130417/121793_1 /TAXON_ID=77928 /ORGANISM="Proteomonas sulcata, Strain CCMP704" /LENGTH=290 /DNA_ID=CAMNT_0026642877 /DNA_START=1 /DNA_END=873 /DNA_ORIENTATION=+
MRQYNQLLSFLLRVKRAQAELQHAWHETQSGRYGRAMTSTLHKATESGRHMTALWALRAEMAFLVNNLLYYLQCDVLDSQYEALKTVLSDSDSFDTVRRAHTKFLDRVSAECLMKNKLAFQTVNTILKIALKYARRMAQWQEIERGVIEEAQTFKRFKIEETASDEAGSYVGFPITVNGEVTVVTDYNEARELSVYKALKIAPSGDMDPEPEDLIGLPYCIQAPTISQEELAEVRQRFQRNALLLFTVLKTSQHHTTPVLSQLLLRLDYNRFFEQQQSNWHARTTQAGRR